MIGVSTMANTTQLRYLARADMEALALDPARIAEALGELGLLAPFHDRGADDIDRVIEACIDGFQDSMRRQSDAGVVPF